MIRIFAESYAKEYGFPSGKAGRGFRIRRTPLCWLVVIMLWAVWFSSLYIAGFYARHLWLRYSPSPAGQQQEAARPDYYLSPQQYIAKKQPLPQADVASDPDEELPAPEEDDSANIAEEPASASGTDDVLRQRVREALRMSEKTSY